MYFFYIVALSRPLPLCAWACSVPVWSGRWAACQLGMFLRIYPIYGTLSAHMGLDMKDDPDKLVFVMQSRTKCSLDCYRITYRRCWQVGL